MKKYIIISSLLFFTVLLTATFFSNAQASDLDSLKNRYVSSYRDYINAIKSNEDSEKTEELLKKCISDLNEYKKAAKEKGIIVSTPERFSSIENESGELAETNTTGQASETADETITRLKNIISSNAEPEAIDNAKMQLADVYMTSGMPSEAKALFTQVASRGGILSKKAKGSLKLFETSLTASGVSTKTNQAEPNFAQKIISGISSFFSNAFNYASNLISGKKPTQTASSQTLTPAPASEEKNNSNQNTPATFTKNENEAKNSKQIAINIAEPIKRKILVINFDPILKDGSTRLHTYLRGYDPQTLAEDCIATLKECSYGVADYKIADWIDVDGLVPFKKEFFKKEDSIEANFTDESDYVPSYKNVEEYIDVLNAATLEQSQGKGDAWHSWRWHGNAPSTVNESARKRVDFAGANYKAIFKKFKVIEKINNFEIDELWIFAPHMSGLCESLMAGPGAFFINGSPIADVKSNRRFAVMGYNYSYPVSNMLEDFGHRMEFSMDKVFGSTRTRDVNTIIANNSSSGINYFTLNLWERFVTIDILIKGRSGLGSVHFAPNSKKDYEWSNETDFVNTYAPDWAEYPNMTGKQEIGVNCHAWTGKYGASSDTFDSMREHHKWWLRHIPHFTKTIIDIDKKEYLNNWWYYLLKNTSTFEK